MKTNLQNNTIWEQLIKNSIEFPINWSELEGQFEIKKLELQKLQPQQIKEKRLDFEKKYMLDHQISKSWMENQYRVFTWFLFTYAKFIKLPIEMFGLIEWNIVSECFCKQPLFCKYFYLASKKIKSSEWATDEDDFIQKMVRSSLNKKWTQIGLQLFKCSAGTLFRKPKSIRERWLSHLNPQIKKNDWDLKQDLQLIKYIKEKGRKWSKIAKIFGNRTEHTIKNRYNQLLSKYQRQAKAQKIDFLCLNQDEKIQFMESEINKYQKISQIKSAQTLPEPLRSQIKIQEEEIPIYGIKVFQPIILSMRIQEDLYKN